ncbi:MAG: hypothetical protein WD267_08980 [Balneolales bacterium]
MKSYTLQPDWKDQLPQYLVAGFLVPFFGLGLLMMYTLRKRQNKMNYVITDNDITINNSEGRKVVTLADIEEVEILQSWLEGKFNIGRVWLQTTDNGYELRGIQNPGQLEDILRIAMVNEKNRLRQQAKVKGDFPDLSAGSVDKVNTLIGLWQQGLINDEEYERERKKI